MRLGILLVFVVACDAKDEAPRDVADVSDVDGSEVAQPPFTSCPIVDPGRYATCTFEGFCGDEPQSCCGITSAGSGYGCSDGGVYMLFDDTCFFTSCSPGCGPNEFATSETCTACSQIDALVHARLTTAAAAHGVCETNADCVRASVDLRCGTYCDVAVNAAGLSGFQADAAVIDEQDCGFERGPGRGCETAGHCSPVGDVRCVANVCRDVAACDPEVIATGAVCDDGDACTVGETCVAAFACEGTARDCDDHDPCTNDACDSTSGCSHQANAESCEVADNCSVGGICERGSCTASAVVGFTRVDAVPFRFPEAVSARPDGTLVVGGWQGQFSPGESFILSYDARGEVTGTITLAQPQRLSDLIALDDGGFLVAGESSSEEPGSKNALDGGDIILWGTIDRDRWLRRVTVDGAQVWRQPVGAEAVVVRAGGLDLVGTDCASAIPARPTTATARGSVAATWRAATSSARSCRVDRFCGARPRSRPVASG